MRSSSIHLPLIAASFLALLLSACLQPSGAAGSYDAIDQLASPAPVWIELGTQSGPIPGASRSQPAHLLRWQDQAILIDVGDGASQQLVKAGVGLAEVETVFISHLHFDHIGGLFALLSLRYQSNSASSVAPLVIYGPPGTADLVGKLDEAILSAAASLRTPPRAHEVHELSDGAQLAIGGITVTTAANSHYILSTGQDIVPVSLSYRFEAGGSSVVYTGDTGPSRNLEILAKDADLLVSEIMDVETALAQLLKNDMVLTDQAKAYVHAHFTRQHLTPEEVGKLAAASGVRSLVLTHFGGASDDPEQISRLTRQIAEHYDGPIRFADDLDRFSF